MTISGRAARIVAVALTASLVLNVFAVGFAGSVLVGARGADQDCWGVHEQGVYDALLQSVGNESPRLEP